jgi:hypothetical protein
MTKEQTILLLDACKEGVMEYQNRKGSYQSAERLSSAPPELAIPTCCQPTW